MKNLITMMLFALGRRAALQVLLSVAERLQEEVDETATPLDDVALEVVVVELQRIITAEEMESQGREEKR